MLVIPHYHVLMLFMVRMKTISLVREFQRFLCSLITQIRSSDFIIF